MLEAEANLRAAEIRLPVTQKSYERARELLPDNVITQERYDQAEAARHHARYRWHDGCCHSTWQPYGGLRACTGDAPAVVVPSAARRARRAPPWINASSSTDSRVAVTRYWRRRRGVVARVLAHELQARRTGRSRGMR